MAEYIDREAAIAWIYELIKARQSWLSDARGEIQGLNAAMCAIEDIPAADVRPVVRTEFVRCGDGKCVPYMCAHCGKTVPANLVEIWGANFCPNCGARMEES